MQFHYVPSEDGKIVRLKDSGEVRTLTGLRAIADTSAGIVYAYQTAEAALPELGSNIEPVGNIESEAQMLAREFRDAGWRYEADELEAMAKLEGVW